ncbi:50S ribosomal protein L25 [candidate division WWE3 bacterium CG06_land_8_20_14_3_00_42_16]|uniref:Large ribosomal subunit protein bL25 n=4 Tax=Katanobacteria TaxID=422282 RepID=A0A2M7AMK7_UNCKA|nr:MAG: 50S ribosomal protein L25 [candidate division WWE3 bacterium CG06_land_8_20_14_3_00_42_16]PIZ42808.1 MAG: 50S ribosomal protein L25 [candidate division WWE3 bacterium CG_4_10_14_0_2_um_filter_42_8]PJA37609.1 MAG: 50S ribosomal protein L25 [candidate division WWE3 bacterium CG_4_9_14_3_um_filter_43_9]PJC69166.1 MAG: 50S ribosomal protein L25 [candidate division WWE3 bacterium CG_4_8_14_3_um_filter_42_11]
MEKLKLKVEKRELVGKKAKRLRRENWVLGNIYGKGMASIPVAIHDSEFKKIYQQSGETNLIEVEVGGEKARPVLIKDVQLDVVSSQPLHVDFHQVDLKEKITTTVPLEIVGESTAVEQNIGILLNLVNEIEVECLPEDIPNSIRVDISSLTGLNQAIFIKDLPVPPQVDIKTPLEEMVCKIEEPVIKEEVEEVKPAEVEGEAVAEGEEGKEAGETEETAEEEKKEK